MKNLLQIKVIRIPLCYYLALLLTSIFFSASLSAGMAYHGNTNTRKFHESGCRYYDCPHCTAVFQSRDDAIDAGYVPCKVCDP